MNDNFSFLAYLACFSLILFIAFGYWFFRYLNNMPGRNEVFTEYKTFLDDKLIPPGFRRTQAADNVRDKTISYQRDFLEIALSFAPPFRSNRIYFRKWSGSVGEPDLVLDLDSADVRNNFTEILDKWLAKNP